ncbi:hypothetical protein NMG60_11000425 [Bertholletia excelsa]
MERGRNKKLKVPTIGEGNRQLQKQRSLKKLASDSSSCSDGVPKEDLVLNCEFGRSSSKRVVGTPIKKLLAQEMSKETESKRRPPSVIARLMGLDGLPPQQPFHKQHKGISETSRERTASLTPQRAGKSYERHFSRKNSMEQQEFKDVYEVLETSNTKQGSYLEKGMVNSKLSEAEMEFIQQKFMDAKRLSTDERLHSSKEFSDTLDMLDTNKDLLMKFLEQPDSLFTKHLIDLQSASPRSQCSHITVIKPSSLEKYENNSICRESYKETMRFDTSSHQKCNGGFHTHSYNHNGAQKPLKLSRIQLDEKHDRKMLPTRIVVLKPNLEAQNAIKSGSSPSSSHGYLSDCRKHIQYHGTGKDEAVSHINKGKTNDLDFMRPKSKESREIAKEITRRMRESFRSEQIDLSNVFRGYAGDDSSYNASGSDSGSESELIMLNSRKSFHWNNRQKSSSRHLVESSVSREAKKRLSERWRMSQGYYHPNVGEVGEGSTLAEMLALPDREMRRGKLDPVISLEGYSDGFASNEEIAEWNSPSGISSRDGWRNGCVKNSSRWKSVTPSSVGCIDPNTSKQHRTFEQDSYLMQGEAPNCSRNIAIRGHCSNKEGYSSRNLRSCNKKTEPSCLTCSDGTDYLEEKQFSLSEMETDLERKDQSEHKSLVSEVLANSANGKGLMTNAQEDAGHIDIDLSSVSPDEILKSPASFLEPLTGPFDRDSVPMKSPVPEVQSPVNSKEADHPSPVSVLEVPFSEDVSSGSECFERISADLHELRLQLKLLKMESGAHTGNEMLMSSDKDVAPGTIDISEETGVFKDESWESSYIVDVLINSGFDNPDPDLSISSWHSPESPLNPWLFENLEKKYCNESTLSRSERRLLFDRINFGLLEIFQLTEMKAVTRKAELKWPRHGVKHELHKLLEREEKEANEDVTERVLDWEMQWVGFGDGIELVGRELERLLIDDLIMGITNM